MDAPAGDPLVQGLAEGRAGAVAAVYDRFGPALFRVALTLLGPRDSAEDAVQEVFLGLIRARGTDRRPAGLPVRRAVPRRGQAARPVGPPTHRAAGRPLRGRRAGRRAAGPRPVRSAGPGAAGTARRTARGRRSQSRWRSDVRG